MTTMIKEVYDAFIEAGVSEEKAGKAAEAISEESLATKADIAELKAQLLVVKWMVGFNLAACFGILLKVLSS